MAKELKDLTKSDENYSQWYNDLVVKAGLAENSAVRGCMVIKLRLRTSGRRCRPRWTGCSRRRGIRTPISRPPSSSPSRSSRRKADHVGGFAKECAVVTHYRLKNDPHGKGVVVDPEQARRGADRASDLGDDHLEHL